MYEVGFELNLEKIALILLVEIGWENEVEKLNDPLSIGWNT